MMAFVNSRHPLLHRTAAGILDLFSHLRSAIIEVRENRSKLEADLFRNRYHLTSKNDDDLPIAR